jgi:hypothetical protein
MAVFRGALDNERGPATVPLARPVEIVDLVERAGIGTGQDVFRLVRALAVETHENWLEQHRYLNMDDLREHKKEALRRAA